jgi:hypothetical protein
VQAGEEALEGRGLAFHFDRDAGRGVQHVAGELVPLREDFHVGLVTSPR